MSSAQPKAGPFGVILVTAMAVSAYTPFILSVLAPFIIEDLTLSVTQMGMLTGTIFLIGGLGAPVIGPVVDVFGSRRILMGLYATLAVAWVAMSWSPGFGWLLLATSLSGVVRAASNPVGNHLVVHHAPLEQRGLIMGIGKSGAQLAGLFAGAVLPTAALLVGWRTAVLAGVVVLIAAAAGTLAVIPPDAPGEMQRAERSQLRVPRDLIVWLAPHAFLIGFSIGQSHAYLPLFAVSEVGQSPAEAGLIAASMAGIGILGRILWGRQAELFSTTPAPLILLAGGGAVSTYLVAFSPTLGVGALWIGALVFGVTAFAWIPVGMLAIIRESPPAIAGKTTGIILATFYLGTALAPVVLGALVDATGTFVYSWLTSAFALTVATVIAVVWHRRILAERAADAQATGDQATGDPAAGDQATGDRAAPAC